MALVALKDGGYKRHVTSLISMYFVFIAFWAMLWRFKTLKDCTEIRKLDFGNQKIQHFQKNESSGWR
jgi:hypothetical protein